MTEQTRDAMEPLDLLREELGRVTVSQGFAGRVRERLADDLEPLRAELADLTVSPEFAVRVRQGIDAAAQRPVWGFNWRWAVPAAGLAAAAIAAVVMWPRPKEAPPISPVIETARVESPAPVAPPVVNSSTSPVAPPVSVTRAGRSGRTVQAKPSALPASDDPFLNVITDQPELLRKLQISIERADVAVDATEPETNYVAPKLEVPKVEVTPISLFVVPNPRLPAGVSPVILRIAADAAERSSK